MHKVRLTQNNYQLVAEAAGQSPEVLMSNYNEIFDQEKRTLSMLVETSFYPSTATGASQTRENTEQILQVLQNNPDLSEQILQLIKSNAVSI